MDLPLVIKLNPLAALSVNTPSNKPSWFCNHPNAKVTDPTTKRYNCLKCNPRNGAVRKVSQEQILGALKIEQSAQLRH
jgi:hypothetical protein